MKLIIKTDKAPSAVGPYSQAVDNNGTLYVSGQIPLIPGSTEMAGSTIESQTKQVMENLKSIIEAAGYTMENVAKCTCLLTDMNEFKAFNEIYGSYFPVYPPARATFQVAALPLGAKVEVDAIVIK